MKSMLILVAVLVAALDASASGLDDPFAGIRARRLDPAEAALVEGGDVRIKVNADRTKALVEVSARKDSRTGHKLAGSAKSYEVEVHNRVRDTKEAAFMPKDGQTPAELKDKGKLSTKPEKFPAGTWKVTSVEEREGKYGPYMFKTDAVGEVEVFDEDMNSLGRYKDIGYAAHSNEKDFSSSQSDGCIILKQSDNRRIAKDLKEDRRSWGKGRQWLTVDRD